MWSQPNLRWVQAALLFAVCGGVSSQLLNGDTWLGYLLPVPFGVLSAWLFVKGVGPGVVLVVLDIAVWQMAYRLAVHLGATIDSGRVLFALCLAGLVGAVGVTLATALTARRTPPPGSFAVCALGGALCGLPFAYWQIAGTRALLPDWALAPLCFAVWQGAVGLCLWRSFRA